MKKLIFIILSILVFSNCNQNTKNEVSEKESGITPFLWENANIYFLLTDRFNNGNQGNDVNFDRTKETAVLRGFEGGDIQGITNKIEDGYFTDLGITAIWFTPVVEQIHGNVDEGSGSTYGYHGYWTKDWTALDPNFGNEADLADLVETAHAHGIRIVLDVVINHTGPVTTIDKVWPGDWVRTDPQCTYQGYESTVECTLVENLPDIKTENDEEVELPQFLLDKWEKEGRLEKELKELDEFFARTGYPRAPRFYIVKWITDYIKKYGVDGFRVDTVKHTEASIWAELYAEAVYAFKLWKSTHSAHVLDDNEFYMVGEVYGYNISSERQYDYGDEKVDFFSNGFNSLINFEFKSDANDGYETIFSKYDTLLHGGLKGKSIVNYLSSHDDGGPYDQLREKPIEAGTKLLLTPGATQVYYGDETSRSLVIEGTEGDATLRSFMNWDELESGASRGGYQIKDVLAHWQKLGRFRSDHPAVGAGRHQMKSETPYLFTRTLEKGNFIDLVLVGLDLEKDEKSIDVSGVFKNGTELKDYYSGQTISVSDGKAVINSPFDIVLLGS